MCGFAARARAIRLQLSLALALGAAVAVLSPASPLAQANQPTAEAAEAARLLQPHPVEDLQIALIGEDFVLAWVKRHALPLWQFQREGIQERINAQRPLFTNTGWRTYLGLINSSGIAQAVVENDLNLTSELLREPVLSSHGQFEKEQAYTWVVDIPLKVSYQAGVQQRSQGAIMTVVLQRVPVVVRPDGLIISGINVASRQRTRSPDQQ